MDWTVNFEVLYRSQPSAEVGMTLRCLSGVAKTERRKSDKGRVVGPVIKMSHFS